MSVVLLCNCRDLGRTTGEPWTEPDQVRPLVIRISLYNTGTQSGYLFILPNPDTSLYYPIRIPLYFTQSGYLFILPNPDSSLYDPNPRHLNIKLNNENKNGIFFFSSKTLGTVNKSLNSRKQTFLNP